MKMDRQVGLAAIDVEKFSKIGTNELKQGRITPAIDAFEYAYRKSKFLNDPPTERSCAFNLGAAYIAGSEFHDGLEILKYAEPPDDKKDTRSNGDLYFNFGLGLEGLKVYGEAINYYKLAKEEYNQERDNTEMEADAIEKMAKLYNLLGKKDKALASYKELCGMYELMGKTEKQAATLFEQANHCLLLHNSDQAEELADECLRLMGNCDKNQKIGNMYNDTGLLYTQLQKYEKAVTCFEEALPIIRSNNDDKKREAVILQNLGAIYNFLGDYQRSIAFHEEAASKYAALQNRKSQGQCFANLAFAFSQLQDTEGAGEAFLHALQAASDTEDKRTMWQVLEGLGAVAFNRNDVEKCIKYLKRALGIIATDGSDVQSQERIVGKLTFALQKKIAKYSEPSATSQYNDSSRQLEGNHRATTPASNRRSNRDRMKTPPANRESEQGGRNASRQSDRQLSETKPAVKKLAELPTGEEIVEVEGRANGKSRLLKIRRTGSERQFTKICRGLAIGDTPREIPEVSSVTETETESETETETETEISESEESRDSETERKRPVEKRKEDSSGYETPIPQQELLKQREDKLVTKAEVHRESAKRREDPTKNGRPMTSKGQGVRINNAPSLLHTEDEKDRQKMQEHYLKFLEKNDDSPVRKPVDAQQITTEESELLNSYVHLVTKYLESSKIYETESGSTYDSSETETSEEETEDGEEQQRNNSQNALKPTSGMNYANLTYEEPVQQRGRNAEQSEKDKLSRTDPTYATIDFERTDKLNLKSRGSEAVAAAGRHNNDEKENTYETIENINREEHPILSILPRAEQERLMFKEHQKIQEEQKNKVEQEELKRKQAGDSKTCVVM